MERSVSPAFFYFQGFKNSGIYIATLKIAYTFVRLNRKFKAKKKHHAKYFRSWL